VTAATAWRATVPTNILPLVFTVMIGGSAAGFLAEMPLLFFTSAIVAAGLAAAATFGPRTPESNALAAQALAQLPNGEARTLLADLLQRAAAVPAVAHAGPLVSAACEAARQLSALEVHLAAFHANQDTASGRSPRWRDAFERCERGSALLTQRLQDASAALSRWQAAQGIGVGESLGELARELNDEIRYQQQAAREVEVMLS
jgi:poly(3-hydroxybutyrate) depolymerase